MKDISELLKKIQKSLNIPKRPEESEEEYSARLAYSFAGRWALASLSDINSDGQPGLVSVHHFKKVFIDVFRVITRSLSDHLDLNQLATFACEQYKSGGFYYQVGKTLSNPVYKESSQGKVVFLRGMKPKESVCMSGLGPYKLGSSNDFDDFSNFWDLRLSSLQPLLKHYVNSVRWEQFQGNGAYVSMLSIKDSINGFRWGNDEDECNQITLARTTVEPYQYFLSKTKTINGLGFLFVSYLPDFFKTDQVWMDLACSLIQNYHGQVKCRAWKSGNYYLIRENELALPGELRSLLFTYSWPLYILSQNKNKDLLIKKEIIESLLPELSRNRIAFEICK